MRFNFPAGVHIISSHLPLFLSPFLYPSCSCPWPRATLCLGCRLGQESAKCGPIDHIQPAASRRVASELRMSFYIFGWWKKNPKRNNISIICLKWYKIRTLVSINKVWLEHSYDLLFTCYLWLLLPRTTKLGSCNRGWLITSEIFAEQVYRPLF